MSNVVLRALKSGRRGRRGQSDAIMRRTWTIIAGFEDGRMAYELRLPLEVGKDKGTDLEYSSADFSSGRTVPDF